MVSNSSAPACTFLMSSVTLLFWVTFPYKQFLGYSFFEAFLSHGPHLFGLLQRGGQLLPRGLAQPEAKHAGN